MYLSPAPLYHAAPLRFNMAVHRLGGTAIVMERFDPAQALELIERHRVTHAQMVPTMFVRMLKLPRSATRYDLSCLRGVIHAAAPCPPESRRQMIDWLGPIIYEYYSATEGTCSPRSTPRSGSRTRAPSAGRCSGTPHILDDDGNELPAGEPGTVWSEGGADFEYHNDPEKTAGARNDARAGRRSATSATSTRTATST